MQNFDDIIPFSLENPDSLDSKKLYNAYQELLYVFPEMYSLLIVKDAHLILEKYQSPAQLTSAYSVKSITKSIMNALVGIAIRDGLIQSVDQYVIDLIPNINRDWLVNLEGVKIRHMLNMTHGIGVKENSSEMLEIWQSSNWINAILNKPLIANPGSQFFYCTCTTHLLSAVLTTVSNMPVSYYASKMLFHPLGISSPVYWESDPQGINWGGTNMFLTPRMLARFGQLYLADGIWNGQRIFPRGWVEESFSRHADGWHDYATYGYLWWLSSFNGIDFAFASGYGGQYVYVIPALKCVMVLTANSDINISTMQSTTNEVVKDPSLLIRKFLLEMTIT